MTSDRPENLWRHSHRPDMELAALDGDTRSDLLVIGGGFTGCSAALEAARGNADVVLLEARTIGHGGSGRNVGLVNAGLWLPPDDIVAKLGRDAGTRLIDALSVAPDLVFRLIAEHGIDCEATRNGTLHLAHAPSGLRELESRLRQGNRTGAPLQLLDAGETARRSGSRAFFGGLFDPRAGTVQPLAYCRGLAAAARAAGARIFEGSPVREIVHDGTHWIARVGGHRVRARHLLLATNAYADGIGGAPAREFVPVHFSQFATAPLPEPLRRHILPGGEGCWDTDMIMNSVRIDRDGRVIIGGVGNVDGPGATIHRRWAARKLAHFYPELAGLPFEHAWSGAIAMTSDHLPKVLSFGPNALSVFGYSGRGIGPGTVFGKQAARALLRGDTDALPVPLTESYSEGGKRARTVFFEVGALAAHALRPGPFVPRKASSPSALAPGQD
ncbi:FAD-binding oxidoreductase [Sedimentitalea sp. JM2-8]|uniref:FAD-binding oxidoreductase n=1 Tax=Sedimentitalea xiamensis TaxID=3050037 RepID=A0ABT7FH55_9RHOB|nr:FAD-binding oxidoreductase [Sedimentitalea xiamensis]MDK3074470.1 FAD-binding oxidoreductase [Sedimentitalea xiamensis]